MTARIPIGLLPLATILLGAGGCSLVLSWSDEEHPCNPNGDCIEGFSCRAGKCIPEDSVEVDGLCTDKIQCRDGMDCIGFRCGDSCAEDEYLTRGRCDAGQYCRPVVVDADRTYLGRCTAGYACDPECILGESCASGCDLDGDGEDDADWICVTMAQGVNDCFEGCEISWGAFGEYDDTCDDETDGERYCTPLGGEGSQRLVCLEVYEGLGLDDSCSPISSPCKRTMACVGGRCRRHCEEIGTSTPFCQTGGGGSSPDCRLHNDGIDGGQFSVCESGSEG